MIKNEEKLLLSILTDIISGKESTQISLGNINQEAFLTIIEEHKLLPLLYDIIVPYLDGVVHTRCVEMHRQYIKKAKVYYEEIIALFSDLKNRNINAVLLKGMILSYRIYQNMFMRVFGDIDILVNDNDMLEVDKYLRSMGYRQYNDFNKKQTLNQPILKLVDNHEFFPYERFVSDVRLVVEVGKSLHERVIGSNIKEMIQRAEFCPNKDSPIRALSIDDTIIQIIENTYDNSFSEYSLITGGVILRDYIDLVMFIMNANISVDRIICIVKAYNFSNFAYSVFNEVSSLFPGLLWPKQVLDKLMHSNKEIDGLSDRDWLFVKLFDKEKRKRKLNQDLKIDIYSIKNQFFTCISSDFAKVEFQLETVNVVVKFRPSFSAHKLILEFILSNALIKKLDYYMLHFQIYNNNIKTLDSTITINIFGYNGEAYYCKTNQLYRSYEDTYIKKGTMNIDKVKLVPTQVTQESSIFVLVLDAEKSNILLKRKNIIAADLTINKKMEENIYHRISECNGTPLFLCIDK